MFFNGSMTLNLVHYKTIFLKHAIYQGVGGCGWEKTIKVGRAWTYVKGTKAPQAAGVIHTDFEKGFIRAEVIKYDDYVFYGSEAACRDAGKIAVEGKEYVVQDGDIMHFRFNV